MILPSNSPSSRRGFFLRSGFTLRNLLTLIGLGHVSAADYPTTGAKLAIIEAVDSFLSALVLFYLAYSTLFLAIGSKNEGGESRLPEWPQFRSTGRMKKTLLEVIVVLLAIVFLQTLAEHSGQLDGLLLSYPGAMLAIAAAPRLIPFDR